MWKRGGRSSALDRAQALLSSRRSSRGVDQSTRGSAARTQGTANGSIKTRSIPPDTHTLSSDLSDLSSTSSAPEHGADTMGSPAPDNNIGRATDSKDFRPQSSLGAGGSRFLKKAPPPAVVTSQSPVSKSKMQQMPEPRYVPSSQHGSQTAALRRLAQIESRFRSRMQPQEQPRQTVPTQADHLTSDLRISPPAEAVSQSLGASLPVAAQGQGKRFLKNKANAPADNFNTAASGSPKGPDDDVMSWSRTAGVPLVGLDNKLVRPVQSVSLESDEEDMRKLLGESLDSIDNSFLRLDKISSMKQQDKILSQAKQKACFTPPPDAVQPPSSAAAPASPSHSSSPFRFTGQAHAHFSPSALSLTPPHSERLNSPLRASSPRRSLSSMSGCGEVLSLDELFPVEPVSEDLRSEMSVVYSEDFKINVMTLDELVPVATGFTKETPEKEQREKYSPGRQQELPGHKEEEEQEDILNYQSDFESRSRTEQNYSASQVSEHLPLDGDEEEAVPEVSEGASDSSARTEADYSSTFSDRSLSRSSRTSDRSGTAKSLSRSRDSRSSASQTPSDQSKSRAAAREGFKEAAAQTWLTGMASSGPALGLTYMNPTPVAALSAETVEALSTYNPIAFVLNEMLKQQLAIMRQFIESRRRLHSSLVQSLEPPNYRYTTLEDTKEYIRRHRPPKLTVEEARQEVTQEMKDRRCTVRD